MVRDSNEIARLVDVPGLDEGGVDRIRVEVAPVGIDVGAELGGGLVEPHVGVNAGHGGPT